MSRNAKSTELWVGPARVTGHSARATRKWWIVAVAIGSLALTIVSAGCGAAGGPSGNGGGGGITTTVTGGTTTTGSAGSLDHPKGKNEVVLQIKTGGGFVPIEYNYTNEPEFSLYGDGRVIVTGPVIAIYPGPALPNLQTTVVSEDMLQTILSAAREVGLFDSTFDYGQPTIADASTTTFVLNAGGASHEARVYALGMESGASGLSLEQQQARAALNDLRSKLMDLSAFEAGEIQWTPYQYSALAVYSQAVDPTASTESTDIMPGRLDWPLGDLSTLGEEVQGGFRKVVVSGQDLQTLQQKPPLEKATAITLWKSNSRDYHLLFRPLLPEETP